MTLLLICISQIASVAVTCLGMVYLQTTVVGGLRPALSGAPAPRQGRSG